MTYIPLRDVLSRDIRRLMQTVPIIVGVTGVVNKKFVKSAGKKTRKSRRGSCAA